MKLKSRYNFVSKIKLLVKKTYELSRDQVIIIKKYIDDILDKKYIRFSTLKYVASMLIIKKLNDELRVCVDYKTLNKLIIKNRNAFFLIKNTLVKLCFVKYFNKFDIITIFNKIRMRYNDKKKTAFFTKYDFFEYVVMLFELCNAFKTFQLFINVTLHEYLNNFCISYINNILIYSKTRKKHVIQILKVFKRLQKANLFLNINKCKFFVTKVRYLKLIITIEKVKINSIKIKVIVN